MVALAALAAGCAPMVWTKPGATEQAFYQDRGACQAQAFSIPNAPPMQLAIVFSSCMQGKGWYQAPAK